MSADIVKAIDMLREAAGGDADHVIRVLTHVRWDEEKGAYVLKEE